MDSHGRVTSHLSGLFYRTAKLIEAGILPCYVFDGKPPELKSKTTKERKEMRADAEKKWKEAREKGEMELAKRYAQASSKLTDEMVEDSKKLLDAMGVPWVQAPGEGEAQAAFIASCGDVWASASQDYDSLLFGSPRLVRNLTITGKRKLPMKNIFVEIEPELIELEKVFDASGIDQKQLVEIGLLIGTDFNRGVEGVGPKRALQAVKEGKNAEDVYAEHGIEPEVDLKELRKIFLKPNVTKKYSLEWKKPNRDELTDLLVEKHDFSLERINKAIDGMSQAKGKQNQERLEKWFK
jgi:flap endonuclease-1